jgi:hypothetical protein
MLEIRFPVLKKKSRANVFATRRPLVFAPRPPLHRPLGRDFFWGTGNRISSIFNLKNEFSVENYPMNVLGLRGKAAFIEKLWF